MDYIHDLEYILEKDDDIENEFHIVEKIQVDELVEVGIDMVIDEMVGAGIDVMYRDVGAMEMYCGADVVKNDIDEAIVVDNYY